MDEWKTEKAYVLCSGNVEIEGGVAYLPWHMVIFLKPAQLPKGMKYGVDLSGFNI